MNAFSFRRPSLPSEAASRLALPPGITSRSRLSSAPSRTALPSTHVATAFFVRCAISIHLYAPMLRAPLSTNTPMRTGFSGKPPVWPAQSAAVDEQTAQSAAIAILRCFIFLSPFAPRPFATRRILN